MAMWAARRTGTPRENPGFPEGTGDTMDSAPNPARSSPVVRPSHSSRAALTLVLGLASLTACRPPNHRGPQVQEAPLGFLLQNESYQTRRMFPDREVTLHSAWIRTGMEPYSGIYINGHPGVIGYDEVAEAQQAARAAAEHPQTSFGEIEPLTIDGRDAWGWEERLATPSLGLDWVKYSAVIPYDTISYAVEFYSGDPRIKPHAPDTLKAVIGTFAIGRTEWNLPLIAIFGGLVVLAVAVARSKAKERSARVQRINLVKIPKPEETKEGDAGPSASTATGAATATPQAAPQPPPTTPAPPAPPPSPPPTPTEAARPAPPAPPAAPTELRTPKRPGGDGGEG